MGPAVLWSMQGNVEEERRGRRLLPARMVTCDVVSTPEILLDQVDLG